MSTLTKSLNGLHGWRGKVIPTTIAGGGLAVAWGVVNRPLMMGAAIAFGLLLAFALYVRPHLPRIFLVFLWIVLLGYAFASKGFAYLGYPPLFIGELLLLLGLMTFLLAGGFRTVRSSPFTWLWLAFAAWGTILTVPYIPTYGLDALRDAVFWGYGGLALMVAACLIRTGWLIKGVEAYRLFVPLYIVWVPVAWFLTRTDLIPSWPNTSVLMIRYKPGDFLVHLAGIAAFVLVGLYAYGRGSRRSNSRIREWILWGPWLLGFMLTATRSRGGLLAAVVGTGTVLAVRPSSRWNRLVLVALILGTVYVMVSGPVDSVERGREKSVQQLVENVKSIFSEGENEALAGPRRWRIVWWKSIVDETVFGPRFWTGKGFGYNLAEDAGTYVGAETRSPHSGHLTILARAGVPGLVLWLLLQLTFGVSILKAALRTRAEGDHWWASVFLWILAYWTAFHVNASFDVYLEGPQGGIWFWSIFGLGMAALEIKGSQKRVRRAGKDLATGSGSIGPTQRLVPAGSPR